MHTGLTVAGQLTTEAVTVAELVNDPNRPKTNPAIAMAAMRVIAMRMTVARTGEMAFLLPFFTICIVSAGWAGLLIKGVWIFPRVLGLEFEHHDKF